MNYADIEVTWNNVTLGHLHLFPETEVDGVSVCLADFGDPADFGSIDFSPFEEARVALDGLAFYGGVFSAKREMTLPLLCRCGSAAAALDWIRVLHNYFAYNHLTDQYLTITRKDGDGNTISCTIEAYEASRRAFVNTADASDGVLGRMDSGNLLYVVRLHAPHPHFRSTDPLTDTVSWSGAQGQALITNPGGIEIGMRVEILNAVGLTMAKITNSTTGRYIQIYDDFDDDVIIDWYGSHHRTLEVTKGSEDMMPSVNVGAKLTLVPGDNIILFDAAGTSADFLYTAYPEYDSI